MTAQTPSSVTVRFAWYDLWVGAFYDRTKRVLYVCPLPCLLITWQLRERPTTAELVSIDRDSSSLWRGPDGPGGRHEK